MLATLRQRNFALLGGLLIARVGWRAPPGSLLGWSLIVIGALFAVMINVPLLLIIVVTRLALGPPTMGWIITSQTLLQAIPADRFRGRVFGAVGTTTAVMAVAGTSLGSALGDLVGIVPLYNLAAFLYVVAGLLALIRLRSAIPDGWESA